MLVADHFKKAGERLDAAEWYGRAALRLGSINFVQACRASRDMLALFDVDVDAIWPEGHPDCGRARALLFRASALVLHWGRIVRIPLREADAIFERAEALTQLARQSEELSDREYAGRMAELRLGYSYALEYSGAPRKALSHRRKALTLAKQSGDDALRLQVCQGLVPILRAVGRMREAADHARSEMEHPPVDAFERLEGGGIPMFPMVVFQCATATTFLGHPQEALEMVNDALRLLRSSHGEASLLDPIDAASMDAAYFLSEAHFFLGHADEALEYARRFLQVVERMEFTPHLIYGRNILWHGYWLSKEWNEAAATGERMADLISSGGMAPYTSELADVFLAEARARQGQAEAARALAERALGRIDESAIIWRGSVLFLGAVALLRSSGIGARTEVARALDLLERWIERTECEVFRPFLHEVRAGLALVCGDADTCERERREAERLWTEIGALGHIERMARDLEELGSRVAE
jgi:tetratricopeptide (TPR) repeat protein